YIAGALVHCTEFPGSTVSRRVSPFRGVSFTMTLTKESIWQTDMPPTANELAEAGQQICTTVNEHG
ncbi:hypothetical protein Pmar_PMAR012898, partial [Perkinsus marinus ATCC 50983]